MAANEVILPDTIDNPMHEEIRLKCHAHKKNGDPCGNWAVKGKKVCRMHGANAGRPIIHGLYSKKLDQNVTLMERAKELRDSPELLDNRAHLSILIAALEQATSKIDSLDVSDGDDKTLDTLVKVVDTASKVIERHHKQSVGYYISVDKLELMQKMIAGVIAKHIKDDALIQVIAHDIDSLTLPVG